MDLKSKVLDEIIAMLDEEEGSKLKKHPKLMAMQLEVEKQPKPEIKEEALPESESEDVEEEEELSPEIMKKLLEMIK